MRALLLALLLTACADDDPSLPVCADICPDAAVYFCTDATGVECVCKPTTDSEWTHCHADTEEGSDQ